VSPVTALAPVDDGTLALWPDEEPDRVPEAEALAAAPALEPAVDAAWSALQAGFTAPCLMCGGTVQPRWSAGAGVVGGRCEDCGTELD
jgi:hypothetical protein